MTAESRLDLLLRFLRHLDAHKVGYALQANREDALMVLVATPGKRWEVEFMASGWPDAIQVECFTTDGTIDGSTSLLTLFNDLEIPDFTNLSD